MPGRGEPSASEITPEALYLRRREFIKNTGLGIATAAGVGGALLGLLGDSARPRIDAAPGAPAPKPLAPIRRSVETDARVDPRTPFADITTYNNYYELGLDKSDPAENAGTLKLRPWTIRVSGEVKEELTLDIDTLLGWFPLEERIYRMRCVEAWSMVIPWLGFPLAALVKRLEPTSRAKYLAFTTLLDPEQLPGQRRSVLDWPYVEGLRIDEATHPLAILAVGLYGKTLLGQNGAPIRLVVPWKYGFKGIKSIVKLELTERQPVSTWNAAAPSEYGFYANVNPEVDHPRWSQRTERRIGEIERRITLPFNGYGPEVASLYAGLDLRRIFSVTAAAQSGVRTPTRYAWLKPGVLAGALIPLALLIVEAANRTLGSDPVAIALNRLGLLALIMLLASLSATPARLALGWSWPLRLRRMLGLLAFFYASLHVVVYVAVDQGFAWSAITKDITERKFIGMGFAAFVVLVPLAVTSPVRVRRWMGPLRWQRLHRLVYVAGLFAATHFIWRVKRDLSQPLVYAAVLALLLLVRLRKRAPRS